MVINMLSRAGIKLYVVGGAGKPNDPKEHTIWIKTGTAAPNYILSASEPQNPTEGLVWMKVDGSGEADIPLDNKATVNIPLYSCKIFDGSKWTNAEAWVYVDGKWKMFSSEQFDIFTSKEKFGSWSAFPYKSVDSSTTPATPTTSITDDTITVRVRSGEFRGSMINTAPIDFSEYQTLCFDVKTETDCGIGIIDKINNNYTFLADKYYGSNVSNWEHGAIDVGALMKTGYICVHSYNGRTINVRDIYLV